MQLSDQQSGVLTSLVAHAGHVVSKEMLAEAGWQTTVVTDATVAQTVFRLRKLLRSPDDIAFIETVPGHGYRFATPVARGERDEARSQQSTDLVPYRAFIEGRAALHTLNREAIGRARVAFDEALLLNRNYAPAHIGLANACALTFEASRIDPKCDLEALARARRHAQLATTLAPWSGDAWSTFAFALYLGGNTQESVAASYKAVAIEPDNWVHWLRMGFCSWGQERMDAAWRMRTLCPGLALGHWLSATVLSARGAFNAALDVLNEGCAAQDAQSDGSESFPAVGLHLLKGLVLAAQQDLDSAADAFMRELASVGKGQMYARECAANTWYALGAVRRRQRRHADADDAFARALNVAPTHLWTLAALGQPLPSLAADDPRILDLELARAAGLARAGRHADAAHVYGQAITGSTLPGAGWILPIEPLIDPGAHADHWADALNRVRVRAI